MRIISKFFDVYDLQHSLRDESRVWERKTEEIKVRKQKGEDYGFISGGSGYAVVLMEYFYFCGQVFPMITIKPEWGKFDNKKVVTFNFDKALAVAKEYGFRGLTYRMPGDTLEKQFKSLEEKAKEDSVAIQKMFDKFNYPLGVYSWVRSALPDEESTQEVPCHVLTFNPQLMNNFPWQEIDTNVYRFHQLIEQFLSGVIGHFETIPQMVTTSDKDRLLAHGFDATTSFRKMKRVQYYLYMVERE